MIKCLLWDFGDTLCDELSLWRGSPEWMDVYDSFGDDNGIGTAWSLGQLNAREVADQLATGMALTSDQIIDHFLRVELFEFFPQTYEFFCSRSLPQAIVTVNPALFRDMARGLGLDAYVETIVISAEEQSDDKGVLCEAALSRMSGNYSNAEALLIDNKAANLSQWSARGGPGYLHRSDASFGQDVSAGLNGQLPNLPDRRGHS